MHRFIAGAQAGPSDHRAKSQDQNHKAPCALRGDQELGFQLYGEGPTIKARLSPAMKACEHCLGLGLFYDATTHTSSYCTKRPPQKMVALVNKSHLPVRYLRATLDGKETGFRNYSGNADRILGQLKKYLQIFPDKFLCPPTEKKSDYNEKNGLILSGPVGVGKTFLLVSLAKKLLVKGYQVEFIDFYRLIEEIKGSFSAKDKSSQEIIDPLIEVEILLIDELGKGRNTELELTILDQIVMGRYNQNKPIIATTNYSLHSPSSKTVNLKSVSHAFGTDYFGSLKERVGSRIFSRFIESSHLLQLDGSDYRTLSQSTKGDLK